MGDNQLAMWFFAQFDFLFVLDLLLLADCFRFPLLVFLGGGSTATASSSTGCNSLGLS